MSVIFELKILPEQSVDSISRDGLNNMHVCNTQQKGKFSEQL